ncbi:hypothetical protein HYQ45_011630 [Verticillium longisporum]|uniref:Uncharacterized protein n=1 Tax=Verticillium longisporum TaxID=100787 RepID=A0A8I2ZFY2_VERLO|nr:hypothetical protein HYQ45_011630 [Verticillium longisporum]
MLHRDSYLTYLIPVDKKRHQGRPGDDSINARYGFLPRCFDSPLSKVVLQASCAKPHYSLTTTPGHCPVVDSSQ